MAATVKQPVCLVVIDGWGVSAQKEGNAILNANTPVMDRLIADNSTELEAHGLHVGLIEGLMGNSEVGHLNIGAGRVIYQDIVRINMAVKNNDFVRNEAFVGACNNAKAKNGRLHLLGLVSDGGVHSHMNHMFSMLAAAKELGVPHCFIQFFGDGRDTSPVSAVIYAQQVLDKTKELGYGTLSTLVGRYYAMDRDKRWERIQIAYDGLVGGVGEKVQPQDLINVIKKKYEANENDEFLKPLILSDEGRIKENDTLVCFNYRSDRMREIAETLGVKRNFESKIAHPSGLYIISMTQYKQEFPFPLCFPTISHKNVLAEWLASKGLKQFHCAETEKYAHVTFFFNGGLEKQFENEDRGLIPSPKVPTYDHKPEMSSWEVAQKMIEVVKSKAYPFVMCNFAPPDMVGHTGEYEPCVKACEATDKAIGALEEACRANNTVLMVTSDHGNAEYMIDDKGGRVTSHTCNRVPFTSTSKRRFLASLPDRAMAICDVAPTVLEEMGLDIPTDMGGKPLQAN